MTQERAIKVLAIALCHIVGIEPIDSIDGSPNWWMFNETATKIIADLKSRGFFKEPPKPD